MALVLLRRDVMRIVGSFGGVFLVAWLLVGCAGEPGTSSNDPVEEDELTRQQLPGVEAAEIASVRTRTTVLSVKTIAAPKKVKRLMASVKKLRPGQVVPRCLDRDTTRLTFLDADGKGKATVDTFCGIFGRIAFADGAPGYDVKLDTDVVAAVTDAPAAVGDVLWGVTTIELLKPATQESLVLTGASVKPVLDGFGRDAVPDPAVRVPRCPATYAVTLRRGNDVVASSSFLCGPADPTPQPAVAEALFKTTDPLVTGGITIDPRPVIQAFLTEE